MITKVQDKTLTGELGAARGLRLSSLERAMLRWAVVDPDDKLLDANAGAGMMTEYLRRNVQCEVCGVSDNMEQVRYARSLLQSCDIIYAPAGDIPWREDSFDTVMMRLNTEEPEMLARMFSEAHRVLRPGGQLIIGAVCFPAWMNAAADVFSSEDKQRLSCSKLKKALAEQKLIDTNWQRTGISSGVMIAWKAKDDARQLLDD
ncbi:MAG: class I SAM-dependent methyltransferase [Clostridia bacterium]|nr:class I SAM-dependent methyltransferase [Clostridia bacterium]